MADPLLLALNLAWAALALLFLLATGRIYLGREQLPEPTGGGPLPELSIIVPVRDEEADIGECLQCIMRLDYPEAALEVVVVDDGSTDATASVVEGLAERDPRIRLIPAGPLPEGWTGKSHACWQGARVAGGDWLLFVDADTYLEPPAARAALEYAVCHGRDLLSVVPFQRIVSVQERLVLPGVFLGLASAVDFARVNDPNDDLAIANGQFLLFSREGYRRVGGHEAVRGEVADDLAFARAAKRHRVRAYVLFGEQLVETRMYRSLREIWRGFSKNAAEIMRATSAARAARGAAASFGLAAGMLLPFVMIFGAGSGELSALWRASFTLSAVTLLALTTFFALALRTLRVPVVYLAALPLGLVVHGAIIVNAYFRRKEGRREWKGRRY